MHSIQVTFDIDPNSSTYGKMIITVTTTYGAPTTYRIGVTGPVGVVKALPGAGFEDGAGANFELEVALPVTTEGDFQEGNYTVNVIIDPDGLGSEENELDTFGFSPAVPGALDVDVFEDCYAKLMVVQDNTSYLGEVSRTTTIEYPLIPGEDAVADVVSSDATTTATLTRSSGNAYENVIFGVTVEAYSIVSEEGSTSVWTWNIRYGYTAFSTNHTVTCNLDICGILECLNSKMQTLLDEAAKCGGIGNLPKGKSDQLWLMNSYLAMYNYHVQCQNTQQAAYYYSKLVALADDCGCQTPTGPQVIGNTGIIYLQGDSAYQVWINQGNTGTVDDFLNTLYPVGEWIEVPDAAYASGYKKNTAIPLEYRLLKTHIEFRGRFDREIGVVSLSPFQLLEDTFDPAPIDELGAANIYNLDIGGQFVGQLYRSSTDNRWYVRFVPTGEFDIDATQLVMGMIPLVGIATAESVIVDSQPAYTDWVEIPSGEYLNGYTPDVSRPLEWRTDGQFIFIRGRFDGGAWVTSGFELIAASYWTAQGYTLQEGAAFPVYEEAATGTQADLIGVIDVRAGSLYIAANSGANAAAAVAGIIPIA